MMVYMLRSARKAGLSNQSKQRSQHYRTCLPRVYSYVRSNSTCRSGHEGTIYSADHTATPEYSGMHLPADVHDKDEARADMCPRQSFDVSHFAQHLLVMVWTQGLKTSKSKPSAGVRRQLLLARCRTFVHSISMCMAAKIS